MLPLIRTHPAISLGLSLAFVGVLFLTLTGVGVVEASVLTAIVGIQAWSGAVLWSWVRRGRPNAVEMAGMGLAIGTVAALVAGLAVQLVSGTNLGWILPAILIAVVGVVKVGKRRSAIRREAMSPAGFAGAIAAVVVGVASLVPNLLSYPLSWSGTWGRYHADMLFFESLSTSMARLGPLDSIFSPDAVVRYHWLVYAWAGQVADAAGAEPFVVLVRVLPFVAVVGAGLLAVAWAGRLTKAVWAPTLAVVLLVAGGYVGATYGAIFNFDSPSQALTSMWLLAFALAVVLTVSEPKVDRTSRWSLLALLGLLSFGLAGGKISSGAMALAAVLWVALVGTIGRREWARPSRWAALVTALTFVLGYLLVVSGSADPGGLKLFNLIDRASSVQGLNPVVGSIGIVAGTAVLMVAIAARWTGLLWLVGDRRSRWSVDTQFGAGLALAALLTVVAVSGGMNDTWFALAASAPLSVLSAGGAGQAWHSLAARRGVVLVASLLVAVGSFVVVEALWLTGASGGNVFVSTWRWLGPVAGVLLAAGGGGLAAWWLAGRSLRSLAAGAVIAVVALSAGMRLVGFGSGQVGVQPGLGSDSFSPIESFVDSRDRRIITEWSDRHVAAAEWLKANASTDELVATNVTFSPLVPALTGMQTLASGVLYQAPYGRPSGLPVLIQRETDSWSFIDSPSPATADPLCSARVDWIWVDPGRTDIRDWAPYASVAYENDSVSVLRLNCG